MAKWTFLFFQLIHFLMEKKFPFFGKTILKHLAKYPLHVEASLYMLRSNRDGLLNGVVRLIWRGHSAVCHAPYGRKWGMGVKMKKDGTIADSILDDCFENY